MPEEYGKSYKGRFSLHKRGNGIIYLSTEFSNILLGSGWVEKTDVNCIQLTPSKDGKIRFLIEASEKTISKD